MSAFTQTAHVHPLICVEIAQMLIGLLCLVIADLYSYQQILFQTTHLPTHTKERKCALLFPQLSTTYCIHRIIAQYEETLLTMGLP